MVHKFSTKSYILQMVCVCVCTSIVLLKGIPAILVFVNNKFVACCQRIKFILSGHLGHMKLLYLCWLFFSLQFFCSPIIFFFFRFFFVFLCESVQYSLNSIAFDLLRCNQAAFEYFDSFLFLLVSFIPWIQLKKNKKKHSLNVNKLKNVKIRKLLPERRKIFSLFFLVEHSYSKWWDSSFKDSSSMVSLSDLIMIRFSSFGTSICNYLWFFFLPSFERISFYGGARRGYLRYFISLRNPFAIQILFFFFHLS